MQKNTSKTKRLLLALLICAVLSAAMLGCGQGRGDAKSLANSDLPDIPPMTNQTENFSSAGPDLTAQIDKATNTGDIPRFAANSPFAEDYKTPIPEESKRLWARSCLWEKAPDFVVEKWLTEKPETKGKYLLIEFWATWCSQCRRAVPLLNDLHEKYKDRLAVIGISNEDEQTVRKFKGPKIEYKIAIDTQARMKKELAVTGIPHIIIVEPGGYVVWEGFPLLRSHKLTDEVVGRILAAGEKAEPSN